MAAQQDPRSGFMDVRVEYKIEDSADNSIRHGWVKLQDMEVERSFLGFKTKDEATKVHENLSKLQGVSFLKSYFIIEHQKHYWLAVDKIQYSLEKYKTEQSRIWNGSRLASQYQDIIRGIIIGMCELHGQRYTHGCLSIKDILIVNGKPKFAFIRNEFRPPLEGDNECPIHKRNLDQDFEDLKILFENVIGTREGHVELKHFYESAKVNNARSLSKVYFHPILMAPMERFFQPVRMDTLERYPGHSKASKAKGCYREVWDEENETLCCYDWIKEVEVKEYYEKIIRYEEEMKKKKENKRPRHLTDKRPRGPTDEEPRDLSDWHVFKFVRHAIVHITEHTHEKTEQVVEKELSEMFPDYFNKAYDLFNPEEIASGSRVTHLESPTKDKQQKRTHEQSTGRSRKRTRTEPPSSSRHRQSSLRRSPRQSSSSRHCQSSSSRY